LVEVQQIVEEGMTKDRTDIKEYQSFVGLCKVKEKAIARLSSYSIYDISNQM
jgi:hypothetical protein